MRVNLTLAAMLAVLSLATACSGTDCMCTSSGGGWATQAPLSLGPRQEMGVAAVGGRVHVVGGFDGTGQPIATVEAYAVANNRWTQRASLPAPLHHVNLAAVGGKLYVVGALTGTDFAATGTTLVYDPATDAWSPLSSM
ncbi:MAG: kelch repeat-containing protein, partial [Myxococcaceae bacterium]